MATGKDIASVIFDDLKARILRLDLEPGSPISESDICDEYEASRTPVRTALNRLSDQALIDLLPYQKSRVKLINIDEAMQFIYARVAVETQVIKDFISKGDLLLFEDMDSIVRKQEILYEKGECDLLEFYTLDVGFHEIWFRTAGLIDLWYFFKNKVDYTRLKILDYKREQDYPVIIQEHKDIAAAIREKRSDDIQSLVSVHVEEHIANLIETLRIEKEYYI